MDDARLAGLERIRIIHGKGTGALRQAVHDYLKAQPEIKSFSLAGYREGGTGVTIAFLKNKELSGSLNKLGLICQRPPFLFVVTVSVEVVIFVLFIILVIFAGSYIRLSLR